MFKLFILFIFFIATNSTVLAEKLKWEKEFDYLPFHSNLIVAPDGSLLVVEEVWKHVEWAKGRHAKRRVKEKLTRLDPLTGKVYWSSSFDGKWSSFVPGTVYIKLISNSREFFPKVKMIESTEKNKKKKKKSFGKFGDMGLNALKSELKKNINTQGETKNSFMIYDLELLDLRNGKVIVSKKQVIDYRVLKRSGNILVYGFLDSLEKPSISLFEANTGKRLWSTTDIFSTKKTGLQLGGARLNITYDADALIADPIDLADGSLILALKTGIHKLDMKNGQSMWHITLPKPKKHISNSKDDSSPSYRGVKILLSPVDDDAFFYIEPGTFRMMKYSISDGKKLWNSFAKIKGNVDKIIFTPQGMLLAPIAGAGSLLDKAKIYYYDYQKGSPIWPNHSVKVKGGVKDYRFIDNKKIILQLESLDNTHFINILNIENGMMSFRKDKKVKGNLYYMEAIEQGLLYVTSKEVNVLNSEGEKILKESFKAKNTIAKMYNDKIYLMNVDDSKLFSFDKKSMEVRLLAEVPKAKFGETYQSLDILDDVIVVSSYRNLIRYNFEGHLLSTNHFTQADETKLGKAWSFINTAATITEEVFTYGVPEMINNKLNDSSGKPAEFDRICQQKANNVKNPYFTNDPIYKRLLDRLDQVEESNRYQTVYVGFKDYKTVAKEAVNNNIKKHSLLKENTGIAIVDRKTGEMPLLINIGKQHKIQNTDVIKGYTLLTVDNIDQFLIMVTPGTSSKEDAYLERRPLETYTW